MTAARRVRLGVVVQRWGEDIVGGAEAHARMLALHLADHADITVFTSCARDSQTWANSHLPGRTREGPLTVRRFRTRLPRFQRGQVYLDRALMRRALKPLASHAGALYTRVQGPWTPGLVEALRTTPLDRAILVSYLYYPTVASADLLHRCGVPFDFVPTAHDEPPLRLKSLQRTFHLADRVACNTAEELELVARVCGAPRSTLHVVGCGTDRPDEQPESPGDPRCRVDGDYVLYLGRDKHGVELLGPAWADLASDAPRLVVAGSARVAGAINLGRVSPRDKWWLLAHATAVVQPSLYESLGLTLIEAWQVGRPVLANARCAVLRQQVTESGGGVLFEDAAGLARAVRQVSSDKAAREGLARAGATYAERYSWEAITRFFAAGFAPAPRSA